MIELEGASEDEVILAFVRAEVDASRFAGSYPANLREPGPIRSRFIESPDLTNEQDNKDRKAFLSYRGYPSVGLFAGLPTDISWRKSVLQASDWSRLRHGDYPNWMRLSRGTGYVLDGAGNVDNCDDDVLVRRIRAVAEAAGQGKRFPELILLETDCDELIVFEGTTRATAYAYVGLDEDFPVYVGSSSRISEWRWLP